GCLDGFDDEVFRGQADASSGPRPTISCSPFDASGDVAAVLESDEWTVSSVLVDHRPIEPAVGYLIQSRDIRVAISGDTAVCDGMRSLARGAHVLVHEALLSSRVSPRLLEWNAGARSVGELAAATRPGTLVLTHLIPAPRNADDERAYLDEVRDGGF